MWLTIQNTIKLITGNFTPTSCVSRWFQNPADSVWVSFRFYQLMVGLRFGPVALATTISLQ